MNPWILKLKTQQSNDHENDEFRLQLGVEVEITSCRQDQNMLASEEKYINFRRFLIMLFIQCTNSTICHLGKYSLKLK